MDDQRQSVDQDAQISSDENMEATTQHASEGAVEKKKTSLLKNPLVWLLIIVILIGGYMFATKTSFSDLLGGNLGQNGGGETVAVVNGEEITEGDLDTRVDQVIGSFGQQGQDVSEEERAEARKQLLSTMINTTLMLQAAEDAGITVADEEVEAFYQQNVVAEGQTEEQITNQLATIGLSIDAVKSDIRDQLMLQKYVAANAEPDELAVTDAEIRAYYDQAAAQSEGEVPPLESVRPQIESQLTTQKESQVAQRLIEELKADAEITNNLTPQPLDS